jgi:hypothetical protein
MCSDAQRNERRRARDGVVRRSVGRGGHPARHPAGGVRAAAAAGLHRARRRTRRVVPQTEGVRYSARDVAMWRARHEDVPIVLGSATPSLESLRHAIDGRYRWLRLKHARRRRQPAGGALIDTRVHRADEGLSRRCKAVEQRLERGEQSLLFINRRGYAPVLSCPACGWAAHCTQCSAIWCCTPSTAGCAAITAAAEGPVPQGLPELRQPGHPGLRAGHAAARGNAGRAVPGRPLLRIDRDNVRGREHWQEQLDTDPLGRGRHRGRHADAGQGPRLPQHHAGRRDRRRRIAARRRLPRPGAPVRSS